MAKQYTIENVEELRKRINRDYLIRLTFPKERKRIVVGFTKFCETVGNLHAEHYSRKALKSYDHAPPIQRTGGPFDSDFLPTLNIEPMKRYWFALMDENYEDLGAAIPDGSNKQTAVNRAKRWMQENGIKTAQLQVNSMITDNLLEFIDIEI